LDTNENAEKDEFEARQKEVEAICMPIMTKMYNADGAGAGAPPGAGGMGGMGGMGGGRGGRPEVDPVD